jgi:hypothetical protein
MDHDETNKNKQAHRDGSEEAEGGAAVPIGEELIKCKRDKRQRSSQRDERERDGRRGKRKGGRRRRRRRRRWRGGQLQRGARAAKMRCRATKA